MRSAESRPRLAGWQFGRHGGAAIDELILATLNGVER